MLCCLLSVLTVFSEPELRFGLPHTLCIGGNQKHSRSFFLYFVYRTVNFLLILAGSFQNLKRISTSNILDHYINKRSAAHLIFKSSWGSCNFSAYSNCTFAGTKITLIFVQRLSTDSTKSQNACLLSHCVNFDIPRTTSTSLIIPANLS